MAKSIAQYVNDYVDKLEKGHRFQAREVAKSYRIDHLAETGEHRLPYSDTIQRTLRRRRSEKNDVNYYDIEKSIWWKNDHIATKEERNAGRGREELS